jgi:tetratricopeptide (TPR) repeat protein
VRKKRETRAETAGKPQLAVKDASPESPFGLDWPVLLGLIALLAAVLRVVYLREIGQTPLTAVLVSDGIQYDAWAREIAGGQWLGSKVFYQTPLYPYLLAVFYSVVGRDFMVIRVFQAALSVVSCLLVASAGRRLFNPRVGFVAGLLLAAYPPAIFFDGLIQKTSLDLFLAASVLAALAAFTVKRRARWLVVAGVALGVFTLNRENGRVLFPLVVAWLWFFFDAAGRRRLAWAAGLTAGLLAVVLPVAIRNQIVGSEFMVSTAQLGPNLYIGNHTGSGGVYQPLVPDRGNAGYEQDDARQIAEKATGHPLTAGQVSNYWVRQTADEISQAPLSWVRLMGRKLLLTFNRAEVIDSESIEVYGDYSRLLRALSWLGFGIILPLGALGAWHWRRQWRQLALLHGWVLCFAAAVVLFYAMARYRYPLVPVVMLFASAGLVSIPELLRRGRKSALPALAVTVIVAIFANVSVETGYDPTYYNVGAELLHAGRVAEALPLLEKGVVAAPNLSAGHFCLAAALASSGDKTRARDEFEIAIRLRPDFPEAYLGMALTLSDLGDETGALQYLERAVRMGPDSVQLRSMLARIYAGRGRTDEAIAQYDAALAIQPESVPLLCSAAQLYMRLGRLNEAVAKLEKALPIAQSMGLADAVREIKGALQACRAGMGAR